MIEKTVPALPDVDKDTELEMIRQQPVVHRTRALRKRRVLASAKKAVDANNATFPKRGKLPTRALAIEDALFPHDEQLGQLSEAMACVTPMRQGHLTLC